MALDPIDKKHALQIQAGALGRKVGHSFEDEITEKISNIQYPISFSNLINEHVVNGDPSRLLLQYISSTYGVLSLKKVISISTGALATQEQGKKWLEINGVGVRSSKSDIILICTFEDNSTKTIGVSIKQCNQRNPTNAQLYFTTARGFAKLLNNNQITVSDIAIKALRQFCGDEGFRPCDNEAVMISRATDPRRFFWEEIEKDGREEWERIFSRDQALITKLLLTKAYLEDKFSPDFLLHKTKQSEAWNATEVALYSINELLQHSSKYGSFSTKPYSVRKGQYKDPSGTVHQAPRFGIVQMQRGGQKQHPNQLQFNLQAGYFYKIDSIRPNLIK